MKLKDAFAPVNEKIFSGKNDVIKGQVEWGSLEEGETVLELKGITKRFPGVIANDHIDFNIKAGEIHALLGENGSGKTTLMNILYGLYRKDEGEIFIRGNKVDIKSPKHAIKLGIGMVHQHFMLVPILTVAENVVLAGKEHERSLLNKKQMNKKTQELAEKYGFDIDPNAKINELSVGEKQKVEILKTLHQKSQILIMDEPTAALTPEGKKEILRVIREMASEGKAIIPFITHKLPEVMEISDRVTVLRDGKVVDTIRTEKTTKKDLAKKMVGREVIFDLAKPKKGEKTTKALEVKNLNAKDDQGRPAINDVSFSIKEGEILGLAGVSGNGQRELAEVITGLRKLESGEVFLQGKNITGLSPGEIRELGLAHIPEDRTGRGIIPGFSVKDNIIVGSETKSSFLTSWISPIKKKLFLDENKTREYAEELISKYDVKVPNPNTSVEKLSGGNLQRLILARELSQKPKVLIASKPTRGLDVGSVEYISKELLEKSEGGMSILFISEVLDMLMRVSDRLAVIYEGRIVDILSPEETEKEEIGKLMSGEKI